jgi:hypothetical protein
VFFNDFDVLISIIKKINIFSNKKYS